MSYPPPPPPPDQPGGWGYGGYAAPRTNQKAIWALVLGILGFFLCCLALGVPAIILGTIAKREIAAAGGAETGRSMAQAGFILGIISTLFSALYILAALANVISLPVSPTSP